MEKEKNHKGPSLVSKWGDLKVQSQVFLLSELLYGTVRCHGEG